MGCRILSGDVFHAHCFARSWAFIIGSCQAERSLEIAEMEVAFVAVVEVEVVVVVECGYFASLAGRMHSAASQLLYPLSLEPHGLNPNCPQLHRNSAAVSSHAGKLHAAPLRPHR